MNRLQYETSPYLLQHADNPVDWHAWKEEALRRAQEENKPILVSIGYSTCHWCHVMERESFENEDVAAFMNAHFINIKVDREERPDIDQIYMEACQAINGSGGWPLNVFLTPDRKPFFAGTYYPPQPAYNRPSWMEVLRRMIQAFRNQRDVVEEQAENLIEVIRRNDTLFFRDQLSGVAAAEAEPAGEKMANRLLEAVDRTYGGFGGAPKFPGFMGLRYLLDYHIYLGEGEALKWVHFSMRNMIRGGIYEQLGGGLARYATDRAWLIPHFEKMLYDNALMLGLLADLHRYRADAEYEQTIRDTLAFLDREMAIESGGYAAALDADSEGEEGKFYVWDDVELRDRLGEEFPLFQAYYSVEEEGNWEGKTILWRSQGDKDFAEKHGLSIPDLEKRKKIWHDLLWPIREKRIRPGLDHKVLLSWNALLATALAKIAKAFPEPGLKEKAIRQVDFLLDAFRAKSGRYQHSLTEGQKETAGFLEDYAFLIEALLEVYELDFDLKRIRQAEQLAGSVMDLFLDEEKKFFYFSSIEQADVPLRKRELYDSAQPSGNATMAINLWKLGILTGNGDYRKVSEDMWGAMRRSVEKYPTSFSRWARLGLHLERGSREVAVVGEKAYAYAEALLKGYFPGVIWMASHTEETDYPLLAGRKPLADTKIYICKEYACGLPVSDWREAEDQLRQPT
jgi:hypothetical protein